MQKFTNISYFSIFLSFILFCTLTIETHSQTTNNTFGVPSKGRSTNVRVLEKKIKEKLFSGKYDKEIRPGGEPNGMGPTEVTVNILIRSMGNIDDFKMEYAAQLTMREEWHDPRLRFTDLEGAADIKYITITDTSIVWMPDIFFLNEKEAKFHNVVKPNTYLRITPEGLVMYSVRISLVMSCPMFLELFPMDNQTCSMTMASYGWTTDDLVFKWKQEDPVEVANTISLPRFELEKVKAYSCDRTTTSGSYSCLKADLYLERMFSYYLIQMYVPCVMLVLVSWISFYLDENAIPARTALGITTLLTMATQAASMKSQSAAVSYNKAIDVWSTTCLTFVFSALVEFAVVDYCRRYDKRKVVNGMEQRSWCFPNIKRKSKKVDVIARILFPTLFISFNIFYWTYYLTQ